MLLTITFSVIATAFSGSIYTASATTTAASPSSELSVLNNLDNPADYTLMVYMMGSDLEHKQYSATEDIVEMESMGSTNNVNIIIQTGGGGKEAIINDKRFIDFSIVQRHLIFKNDFQTLENLGEKNMANSNTLSDFLQWGITKFPAKKYAVILWDHGSGVNGFGADRNFGDDKLTPNEIQKAFSDVIRNENKKFELIGFDACLMASVEIADKIKSFGNYMVASEELEPPWGWDYSFLIKSLNSNPKQDGFVLGKTIADSYMKSSQIITSKVGYDAYRTATMSVINLTKVSELVKDLGDLCCLPS